MVMSLIARAHYLQTNSQEKKNGKGYGDNKRDKNLDPWLSIKEEIAKDDYIQI